MLCSKTPTDKLLVLWAQRSSKTDASKNVIYLTIAAPDIPKSETKFDLQPTKLTLEGKSITKHVIYKCDFEFFDEIDPKESKVNHTDRDFEIVLRKKELKEEYWPRLLKEKAKVHWLKTDFDKVRLMAL
jgi:CS domain